MKLKALLFLAVLLPALSAFVILYSQAFSAPYQDDYHAVASFAASYQQQPGWKQKLLLIAAAQHNEYKLGFEHAVVAINLETSHRVNFLLLALLGDLTLLPTAFFLWLTYRDADVADDLISFLPISLLFFSLTYWEALDWAMSGLQNVAIVMFGLITVYFLVPKAETHIAFTRLLLACCAAALASFTSANGFLLAPIGLLILLPRRAYLATLLWCGTFVVPFAAYLYHFVNTASAPRHPHYYLTRPAFFLAFLGGVVPSRWVAMAFGSLILAVVWLAFRTRFDRTNPVATCFTVWILETAALVAWVRGAASLSVASRYSIYAVMMLIFCYAFLRHFLAAHAPRFRRPFYATALVASAAFFVAGNLHAYRMLAYRRSMVLAGLDHYCADPRVNSPMIDPRILRAAPGEVAFEQRELTDAIRQDIYNPPCSLAHQER